MNNVVTIKRHQKQPFPDYWPKTGYNAVVYTLFRQQPVDMQNYYYALKTDIAGPVFSIIVQANKSVLYQVQSKNKAETSGFIRWFNLNLGALRKLSESGFTGTIVGKMAKVDERDIFCAYYIVQDSDIIVDTRTMDATINLKEHDFESTLVTIPVTKLATVHIDKTEGTIRSTDLIRGIGGAIVGFPVTMVEVRKAEDGTEADVPPKVMSTGIHMRYMGFAHVFEKSVNA